MITCGGESTIERISNVYHPYHNTTGTNGQKRMVPINEVANLSAIFCLEAWSALYSRWLVHLNPKTRVTRK